MANIEHQLDQRLLTRHFERASRAVLVADIVESVRLMEQDEVSIVSRWLAFADHVKSQILPDCKGRFVKSLGDGFLLDFDDVRSAISAAFAIQHACNRGNVGVAPDRQIMLRVAVEYGDVLIDPSDLYGRGINLAARLLTLAGPGEIVISANARDQLTPHLDADIEDLGDCFLRHVSQPVRAYRIGPPGRHPLVKRATPMDELAPSIAVVPFSPRSALPDHDVIGEVLAEEVIRALSHSADLNVISRLSTTAFRGRDFALAEIGAHLNADYVLSGSYGSDTQYVTLDAELAEAKSGRILWTDRFKSEISGLLAGEQEIVGRMVAEVDAAVIRRELQRTMEQPMPTLRAYTLLLSAITLMHRLSLQDFEQSRHLLQTLIDRGVRQAIPYAWLANWHVLRVQQGWSLDERQDAYLALEATKRALDTDPNCSLALAVDGFVHTNLLKKFDVALERYDLAIQTNQSDSLAWLLRGTLHAFTDHGKEAVDNTQRALKLSPLDPRSYFYEALAAGAFVSARQFDCAVEYAQRSLRSNRKHTSTLRILAVAQWQLGLHAEARKTTSDLLTLEPNLTVSRWLERAPSASFAVGKEFANVLGMVGVPK